MNVIFGNRSFGYTGVLYFDGSNIFGTVYSDHILYDSSENMGCQAIIRYYGIESIPDISIIFVSSTNQ